MIAIIDYGMGNLKSVENAFKLLNIETIITSEEKEILNSDGIILPGVGAFPDAMDCIKRNNIDDIIYKAVSMNKPLLGICLGMQLLFESSSEIKETKGLGLIKGHIKKFEVDLKIPHMGWNNLIIKKENMLLSNIKENSYVYFVHSYHAVCEEKYLDAYCKYDLNVPAVVSNGNIFGMQFHPEKSGDVGINMLKNFGEMIK
ncbi:imidazole glycerol phosphate synthase subunit HisH [Clostridium aestuarii]|uniref:Imidazole glycerol phosphate synthase subunit HisH n=1 Tax=Clostridium aestuarii TaxID=338193 RepID=A0ABT4CV70_9CLOT|nr:imidazole glycerol phosphate synthase subunit HisH [Clostridium aestuarii]MCY6482883.1 imidazole glycerol phosphate synthase subunit HisH [Clostridium aestuarii]